jgi:hypothetical protein
MKSLDRNKIKIIFFFIIVSLIVLKFFNTPYNFYSLLNWNYEKRMEQNYGFCENESWGFYNFVSKKFDLEKEEINLINDQNFVTPERLFNKIKTDSKKTKFLMILNYQSQNDENIFNGKYDFLSNYKIKLKYNNCYLLELND